MAQDDTAVDHVVTDDKVVTHDVVTADHAAPEEAPRDVPPPVDGSLPAEPLQAPPPPPPPAPPPPPPAPAPVPQMPTPVVPPPAPQPAPSIPAPGAPRPLPPGATDEPIEVPPAAVDVPPAPEAPAPVAAAPAPEPEPAPPVVEKAAAATTAKEKTTDDGGGIRLGGGADDAAILGLSPGAPQITALPGGVTPAFGQASTFAADWRFDFHGQVLAPLRIGIGKRENALVGQKTTTLHAPPVVPGNNFEAFEYTSVILDPWIQLNFSYGNTDVTATVIVASRSIANAEGFFDPPTRVGVNDAFLTFRLPADEHTALTLDVGGFSNRYGNMGEYDQGRYGTAVIGRVGGMGTTGRAFFQLEDIDVVAEAGFVGQINKAPVGIQPAGWNGFADPNVGTSYVAHAHVLGRIQKTVSLGLHALSAFVQDDRATPLPENADGSIQVFGADLRLTAGRFGHLYGAYARTTADQARAVSGVLRVLNAPGGPGLMREYLGPNSQGTGSLNTLGLQYDLSLGNLLRHPSDFEGDAPDLVGGIHGILTHVNSNDRAVDEDGDALYNGVTKLKYGGVVTYSMLSWLATSLRYDRVSPNIDDSDQAHAIISPSVIFRSNWGSQDQVVLQYSRWLSGSRAVVFSGYPEERDPTIVPDNHSFMLSASMWW